MYIKDNELSFVGQRVYKNPLLVSCDNKEQEATSVFNPDPYVMKYRGEYYCYSTGGRGVNVLHSKDMVNWSHKGYALSIKEEKEYWAPCVYYYNGCFYMYYSSLGINEYDCHYEYLKIAVSNNPLGPFKYKKTLFDNFSIDPHVVRDFDGSFYLFYSTNDYLGIDGKRPGTVILVDRMKDLLNVENRPKLAVKPTLDKEIFEANRFGDGRDWHTIEGAFYMKRGKNHYIMYSGNAFTHFHYFVGYSVSKDSTYINDCQWQKYPDDNTYQPILCKNNKVEGTGHNSVCKAPNLVDDWIIYHGREVIESDNGSERRKMYMDPIYWQGDSFKVSGPSYKSKDAPGRATFSDLFDSDSNAGLGNAWTVFGGDWAIKDGQACQLSTKGIGEALAEPILEDYVMECWLKWVKHHMGGLFGLYVCYKDKNNNTQILIDTGKKYIIIQSIKNGIETNPHIINLEEGFNPEAYHHIHIRKIDKEITVYMDDRFIWTGVGVLEKGKIGMITHYTMACFDGISLTQHYETNFDDDRVEEYFSVPEKSDVGGWKITKEGITTNDTGSKHQLIYKRNYPEEYKMTLHMSFSGNQEESMAGIYLSYQDEQNHCSLIVRPFDKRIVLLIVEGGQETELLNMQRKSVDEGDVTFNAEKMANAWRLLVDGFEVFTGTIQITQSNPIFFAQYGHCICKHFSITNWS